jgi:hypothetical protein
MADGRIFLKTSAPLFNKSLSNGPNFGRIHLTGQYLVPFNIILLFQDAKVVTIFNMIAVPCFVYQEKKWNKWSILNETNAFFQIYI